jgi:hypothetical protein
VEGTHAKVADLKARIGTGAVTAEHVRELAGHLSRHTVKELAGLAKSHGTKASGRKADLIDALAKKALGHAHEQKKARAKNGLREWTPDDEAAYRKATGEAAAAELPTPAAPAASPPPAAGPTKLERDADAADPTAEGLKASAKAGPTTPPGKKFDDGYSVWGAIKNMLKYGPFADDREIFEKEQARKQARR